MRWAAEARLLLSPCPVPRRDCQPVPDPRPPQRFPALSGRATVTTIQGYEWARDDAFAQRATRYPAIEARAYRGVACVADWARANSVAFDYLYLPKGATGASTVPALVDDCCWALRASAADYLRFELSSRAGSDHGVPAREAGHWPSRGARREHCGVRRCY